MDKRFLEAFGKSVHMRLLGRTLAPFCLKHRIVLTAMESPLVTGAREVLPVDLLYAVQLCAGEKVGGLSLKDRYWMYRMNNPLTFIRVVEAFKAHVAIERWPKFWEKETGEGSKNGGVPWPLIVVGNLVSNGVSVERAWTMPECQAVWMNAAMAISNGAKTNILTSEEEDFIASQEKAEAEKEVAGGSEVRADPPAVPPSTTPDDHG